MKKNWLIKLTTAILLFPTGLSTVTAQEEFVTDLAEQTQEFAGPLRNNFDATENFVYSPFSYYLALTLLEAGLTNEQQTQLDDILVHPDYSRQDYFNELADFLETSVTAEQQPFDTMQLALGREGKTWQPAYQEAVEALQGQAEIIDFSNTHSYQELNDTIADFTRGLIDPYFSQDRIADLAANEDLQLILMNLLYFKSNWRNEFYAGWTSSDIYYGVESETTVDMMHQTEYFDYVETADFQAVKLPYENQAELVVVLPAKATSNEAMWVFYQEALASEDWERRNIDLSLPKWEMEDAYDLTETLAVYGLEFTDSLGATQFFQDDQELAVSKILQSVVFKLDEDGTEAAAVTEIDIEVTSAPIVEDPIEMRVERPFVYGLNYQNVPLFEGINWQLGE
ncbi:serpin family protein [Fundicoccus culcitae]|uniref:Serpin domain-containing protein n=1 Tax=Fundicoccus culcitae TaxID=2969821 RepID=A0ABY5PAC3_9LACT|nr:serpin family protein [Fundicoccus culcitae]UUX35353.1 hypothetical protein NRE15_06830 [Fundicoccus culcitae]